VSTLRPPSKSSGGGPLRACLIAAALLRFVGGFVALPEATSFPLLPDGGPLIETDEGRAIVSA
jgi:hypothetical protein